MSHQRIHEIANNVLETGFNQVRAQLTDTMDIAFAELVEDIHSWDAQAEHRTGTVGDRETSEILVERLAISELSAEVKAFPFERRVPQDCYIEIGTERISGIPLFDGGETQGVLKGTLGNLGEGATIGVGDVQSTGGGPSQRLNSHRQSTEYQALIGISRSATPGIAMLNADAFTKPFGLPTLIIDGVHAAKLQNAIETKKTVNLSVGFDIELTTATNVEYRFAGTQPDLAPLVVMTPKSSWWTCTAERCGGLVAWLSSARELADYPPTRDVIFTANTGHELGHVGLEHFLDQQSSIGREAHAWVHLGANFAAMNSDIRIQYSNDELGDLMKRSTEEHHVSIHSKVDGTIRPGGEARNIYDAGGRYVSMLGSNALFHHPDDRMANNVDLECAYRTSRAVVDIVRSLSTA